MKQSDPFSGNRFIEIVTTSYATFFLKKQESFKFEKKREYIKNVFKKMRNVVAKADNITQSIYFLSAYSASPRWKKLFGKSSYFKYHYEFYLISEQGLFDRCLHLINAVFQLGLKDRFVKSDIILSNINLKEFAGIDILKKFEKNIEKRREKRNKVVHIQEYGDNLLDELEKREFFDKYREAFKKGPQPKNSTRAVDQMIRRVRASQLENSSVRVFEFVNAFINSLTDRVKQGL